MGRRLQNSELSGENYSSRRTAVRPSPKEFVGSSSVSCTGPEHEGPEVSAVVQTRRNGATEVLCPYVVGDVCRTKGSYDDSTGHLRQCPYKK